MKTYNIPTPSTIFDIRTGLATGATTELLCLRCFQRTTCVTRSLLFSSGGDTLRAFCEIFLAPLRAGVAPGVVPLSVRWGDTHCLRQSSMMYQTHGFANIAHRVEEVIVIVSEPLWIRVLPYAVKYTVRNSMIMIILGRCMLIIPIVITYLIVKFESLSHNEFIEGLGCRISPSCS